MEILQLQYFVKIAEYESLTRASRALHVSQPSLSQMLRRMEEELGVPLFERSGKKLVINENGKYLLERAANMLGYLKETEDYLKKAGSMQSVIYLRFHRGESLFSGLIRAFETAHPYTRFHICTEGEDFEENALHICSVTGKPDFGNCRYLFNDELVLMVSQNSALAACDEINVYELRDCHFINNRSNFLREITEHFCEMAGFTPKFTYLTDDTKDIGTLVAQDFGVMFWPASRLYQIQDKYEIKKIRLKNPPCSRDFYIAWQPGRILSENEREFIDFAAAWFQK